MNDQSIFWRALAEQPLAGEKDDPLKPIRFTASTEGKKADGMDLRSEDWRLDRYLSHPVVLFAHDYYGSRLPIGRGSPFFRGSDLVIDVHFDVDDPFAMIVRGKARKGLVAGSVGWQAASDGGNELLEFSVVPVPLDPKALPERTLRAFQDLGLQVSMLGDAGSAGDGSDRKPPTDDEALIRSGAVLSARNKSDLEQAISLIAAVLDRAKKEEDQDSGRGLEPEPIAEVEVDPGVIARLMALINA